MSTILVTVADDRSGRKDGFYGKTQKYIEKLFKSKPDFGITDYLMWSWDDIKSSKYYEIYKDRLDIKDPQRNGRLYKPLVIKEGLCKIKEGDFLIYNDTSPELWVSESYVDIENKFNWELYSLNVLKKLCVENGGILTAFAEFDFEDGRQRTIGYPDVYNYDAIGYHTNENFTQKSCLDIMDPDGEFTHSLQHASGFIAIQKNEKSIKFINDWVKFSMIPECGLLSYDKVGVHRTDQSVSGLLINKLNNRLVRTLMHKHHHCMLNPYNLLSFCQLNTKYHFVNSVQQEQDYQLLPTPQFNDFGQKSGLIWYKSKRYITLCDYLENILNDNLDRLIKNGNQSAIDNFMVYYNNYKLDYKK